MLEADAVGMEWVKDMKPEVATRRWHIAQSLRMCSLTGGMATKAKGNILGERRNPCPEKRAHSGLNNCHIYVFPQIKLLKRVHFWKMCSEDSCSPSSSSQSYIWFRGGRSKADLIIKCMPLTRGTPSLKLLMSWACKNHVIHHGAHGVWNQEAW